MKISLLRLRGYFLRYWDLLKILLHPKCWKCFHRDGDWCVQSHGVIFQCKQRLVKSKSIQIKPKTKKIKIIKGKYGGVRFCDNMDQTYGLPSLDSQSWDLCLTDPPWGYEESNQLRPLGLNKKKIRTKAEINTYNDAFNESFFIKCIFQILRVSKQSVIASGVKKLNWYIENYPPLGIFIISFNNGQCQTKISTFSAFSPYLCYGARFTQFKFHKNLYHTYIRNGFLRDMKGLTHPYPKNAKDWNYLVRELKPMSVIDPFLGSGTTAEVCETLGIKYITWELNEKYAKDIRKRIKLGQKKHAQQKLTEFF